jgi:uncharacterized membrane protein
MTNSIRRYWIIPVSLVLGLYVGLPFLAPVFMHVGLIGAAKVIYAVYSWQCHQLPERSYFLFGSKLTYSLAEVQNAWRNTFNPSILRQFIGNSTMGWKVAWSDRMVSMYGSLWLFGLVWWTIRSRVKPLPWWGLLLLLLPMAIDGTSHLLSDIAGVGQGFRDSNLWLATLTHQLLPAGFYTGDAWGSFNSIIRLVTGILFGFGIVWFTYPYINIAITSQIQSSKTTLTSQPFKVHDNIHL